MPHEAMDIETVAELLDVSTRQIRTYVASAGMPAGKDGRKPVFVWKDVLNWYVGYKSALEYGERPIARSTTDEYTDETGDDTTDESGQRQDPLRAATLRKTRADADLRELALSRQRGEVIAIADAKPRLDRMLGNLRSQLLGIAPKLSIRLAGEREPSRMEAIIKEDMEALCRDLATGAIVGAVPAAEPEPALLDDLAATADTGLSARKLRRMADRLVEDYLDPL